MTKLFWFGVAGVVGFAVDATVLFVGIEIIQLLPEIARIFSFFAAVFTTWLINRKYTFRTSYAPTAREFVSYVLAMSLGLAVNYTVFVFLINSVEFMKAEPVIALIPATVAAMGLNFITSHKVLGK